MYNVNLSETKTPTIKDVAKHAGVSIMVVSKVINSQSGVREQTRQKVLQSIAKLGYFPNQAAQNLRRKPTENNNSNLTHNLGCAILGSYGKYTYPYYSLIMESIERETRNQKYHLLFAYNINEMLSDTTFFNQMVNPEKIDGLILVSAASPEIVNKMKSRVKTVVSIDTPIETIDSIVVDKIDSVLKAIKHLVQLGHRRIGYVGGLSKMPDERIHGYKSALKNLGLEYDESIVEGELYKFHISDGYRYMQKILERTKPPTAIFAASDSTAIGAMKAIKEKGLKIPEDISIVGFDDIPESSRTEPPLTTIRVPKQEMGATAVRKVMERIKNPELVPMKIVMPTELVIRGSCRTIEKTGGNDEKLNRRNGDKTKPGFQSTT